MIKRISKTRQLEDFGIDKVLDWAKKSKVMRDIFVVAVLIVGGTTACAKALVIETAPLPSTNEKVMPLIEEASIRTLVPIATLAPTETKNPFEGLNICRTWQESVNCPITEKDFRRISDFVKANYKFPPEAFKALQIKLVSNPYTGYVSIHPSSEEMEVRKDEIDTVKKNEGKESLVWSSLSPVGKPLFFYLKKNPPVVKYDGIVAVFPVNNADVSLGTYTIIESPNASSSKNRKKDFEDMPYLPPAFTLGKGPQMAYEGGRVGTLVDEILQDTLDPKGKRKEMIDEWVKTGIIPKELEEMPMFGSFLSFY